jgi:uncharacterized protein with HEPN domain
MKNKFEDSKIRLEQIQKAIQEIENYVVGETSVSFCQKNILHDAVLLQFIIIGESINHVDSEILDKFDYPWYKVRSFRNFIAHEYFNIKLEAVWLIIEENLADLKNMIVLILKNEF